MKQQNEKKQGFRILVGIVSTVSGLVCYALSSSFNNLVGNWNWLKISTYTLLSLFICIVIMFPKMWRHWRIFQYRGHLTFLVLTLTTVYSFYLDTKLKTKSDVYGILSSAAFATALLCLSNQIECGFLDLLYFFCGILISQLMKMKPLFGIVGIGFTYFLIIIRFSMDQSPRSRSEPSSLGHNSDHVAIDMAALVESPSRSRSSHSHSSVTLKEDNLLVLMGIW